MNSLLRKRENLESINLTTQILCFSIISPLVALRLYAKIKLHLPFGVEDASCYAALILFWGHSICALFYTSSGGPVSSDSSATWDRGTKYKVSKYYTPFKQFMLTNKIFYIATMFYVPMVLCVKTSLIYIMIRLWSPYRRKVISLYTFLGFLISYYTVILFVKIFTCNPISSFWDSDNHGGTCLNRSTIIITDSVVSVITDLAILVFPIALAWNLHMPISSKLHIIAILGAGSIAIAFSIYRLVLVIHGRNNSNEIEVFMKVLLCDNAEGGLGLICTCIPAINKLFRQCSGKWPWRANERQRQSEFSASLNPYRNNDDEDTHASPQGLPSVSDRESYISTI
ncbi:hypothetical protein N7475_009997 [Penicillium sp. IBT 31633x]|nr:hypothetical protein N7475_009997 [Penicillium sp. IBT 31633x]